MAEIKVIKGKEELAATAAKEAIDILRNAVSARDYAVWVLAGGSTPVLAYKYIADNFTKALDWSKVYFLIGDERTVAADDALSNYREIEEALLSKLSTDKGRLIIPSYSLNNVNDAADYNKKVQDLIEV